MNVALAALAQATSADDRASLAWYCYAAGAVIGIGGAVLAIIKNRSPAGPVLIGLGLVALGLLLTVWV